MQSFNKKLDVLSDFLLANHLTIAVYESCTGGAFASAITNQPGASRYFQGGLVAYNNQTKIHFGGERLAGAIKKHGVVSQQVAELMAWDCQKIFAPDIAIACTGYLLPNNNHHPIEVFWAMLYQNQIYIFKSCLNKPFIGRRSSAKKQTMTAALNYFLDVLNLKE